MREPTRTDTVVAVALTIGSAAVVAAIMLIGQSDMSETTGLVMFPGVLAVGTMWLSLRRHSGPVRLGLSVGLFVPLFLIGLGAGLAGGG
ncbi:MAG: hypothetical protein R3C39_16470 [Dehalococcoidia bacterium]